MAGEDRPGPAWGASTAGPPPFGPEGSGAEAGPEPSPSAASPPATARPAEGAGTALGPAGVEESLSGDNGAPEGGAPGGDDPAQLGRERDEYLDSLRRLQAEFDNYRKRVERQQRDIVDNAATSLVKKLLPVLDATDMALAHGSGEDVKQLAAAFADILSKEGLERIAAEGQPFDPELHEAVVHEPAAGDGAPEQPEVSEVLRSGYLWKGRVLRAAMVKVRG